MLLGRFPRCMPPAFSLKPDAGVAQAPSVLTSPRHAKSVDDVFDS